MVCVASQVQGIERSLSDLFVKARILFELRNEEERNPRTVISWIDRMLRKKQVEGL